jgi:hypothetical protein
MDCITKEQDFNFAQEDMEYFRKLIAVELIKGTVMTE